MSDVGAYALLALDIVATAAVIWIVLAVAWWLIRRVLRSRQPADAERPENAVKRRCDRCGSGWWALPGRDFSTSGLRLRRSVRRRQRRGKRPPAAWAARQGWSRCPSCLSRQVRDSSEQDEAGSPSQESERRVSQPK